MLPTRWPDDECMTIMGIKDDVMKFLKRVRWDWTMTQKWPTYTCLTLEFLSTLTVRRDLITREPTEIVFHLNNQDELLSVKALENIYHMRHNEDYTINRFACETYWRAMVEYPGFESWPYVPKSAKGSNIRNPVLRYLHKIIASTIYGRKEMGPITLRELSILAHMLDETIPATGALLAEHFEDVATKPRGEIWIGGLITPIALHYQISLDQRTPLPGNMLLSVSVMKIMNILSYKQRTIFLQCDNDHFPLPNTCLTTINNIKDMGNLQMATQAHRRAQLGAGLGGSPLDRNVRPRLTGDNEEREERMEEDEKYEEGYEEEEEDEDEESPRDRPETSRQAERRHAPSHPTLREEFVAFREETRKRHDEMLSLLRQMHEWHVQQGHFPPPNQ
ncbi:hypothetical protein OROHE_014843 [Orobanche hederae]